MRLETDRLILTTPRKKDALEVFAHRTDKQATLFTGGIPSLSWPEFEQYYFRRCDDEEEKKRHIYSVILKASGKYIGYCGFQYCKILKGTEILFGYSSQYWGNGYAFEAAGALLSYGMETLGYDRVVAAVNPRNPASEKILMKLGMTFAGPVEWPDQGSVNRYEIGKERFLEQKKS